MITISQIKILFMGVITESIGLILLAHQAKAFLQRNWLWLLFGLGLLAVVIYRVRETNRIQEEKMKAMLKERQEASNS